MTDRLAGQRTARLNVYRDGVQTVHLVRRVGHGTPGDTLCGLTRFDQRDENYNVIRKADLGGRSVEGGVFGPDVRQEPCPTCHDLPDGFEPPPASHLWPEGDG